MLTVAQEVSILRARCMVEKSLVTYYHNSGKFLFEFNNANARKKYFLSN